MALKSELMALGMPAALAHRLGFDPASTATAAGTTQGTATALAANNVSVTVGADNAGVILPDTEQRYLLYADGHTLKVYPPSGANFIGIAQNTAISVPTTKTVLIEGAGTAGIAWVVSA